MSPFLVVPVVVLLGIAVAAAPVVWARYRHGDPYDVRHKYNKPPV